MVATHTTEATVVMVAGLDTPPAPAKMPLGWLDALPGLAFRPNGVELPADCLPTVRFVYADDYRITAVDQPGGKVRVLFSEYPETDDDTTETHGKYKGAIARKV